MDENESQQEVIAKTQSKEEVQEEGWSPPQVLTREIINNLEWRMALHLNSGKQHSMTWQNDEWRIAFTRISEKPRFRLTSKRIYGLTKEMRDIDPIELMCDDPTAALLQFIAHYNEAHGLYGEDPTPEDQSDVTSGEDLRERDRQIEPR